jgi:hypothetical protein
VVLGLAVFPTLVLVSRRSLSAFRIDACLLPSRSSRNGDNNGGTDCFEETSTLMEPPRPFSSVPGRPPFVSRERGGGDRGRVLAADFKTLRPFVNGEGLADFPSFAGV